MIWVSDAHYVDGFRIFVKFNDGKENILDMEQYIKSKSDDTIFGVLKNRDNFKRLRFDSDIDTVVWENGADIAPETLYKLAILNQ